MWRRREKNKNRRTYRHNVLDVKLRSDQTRANRMRLGAILFLSVAGPFFGIYLLWRIGGVVLDTFVYENADFAIRQVDVQTDGVIAPEQLRRWALVKPGANLVALDLASVKRNLELQPLIASVSVERVLPDTLKIRVTERDPVAQINVPRADGAVGVALTVYHLDGEGMAMMPLDPRATVASLAQPRSDLPVITGVNGFQIQPGRPVELPQVRSALNLVMAFARSPMAGLVDLRRVDVSAPRVLVATTGQGSRITFGMENLEQQLRDWRSIYDHGRQANRGEIATLNLAVANNPPATWMTAAASPADQSKPLKPNKPRRRNV